MFIAVLFRFVKIPKMANAISKGDTKGWLPKPVGVHEIDDLIESLSRLQATVKILMDEDSSKKK